MRNLAKPKCSTGSSKSVWLWSMCIRGRSSIATSKRRMCSLRAPRQSKLAILAYLKCSSPQLKWQSQLWERHTICPPRPANQNHTPQSQTCGPSGLSCTNCARSDSHFKRTTCWVLSSRLCKTSRIQFRTPSPHSLFN